MTLIALRKKEGRRRGVRGEEKKKKTLQYLFLVISLGMAMRKGRTRL